MVLTAVSQVAASVIALISQLTPAVPKGSCLRWAQPGVFSWGRTGAPVSCPAPATQSSPNSRQILLQLILLLALRGPWHRQPRHRRTCLPRATHFPRPKSNLPDGAGPSRGFQSPRFSARGLVTQPCPNYKTQNIPLMPMKLAQ